MHILSSVLFAFSANIDNIPIGAAYGVKQIKIGFVNNLLIAFITCLGTVLSMTMGELISIFLSPDLANIIGCILLILMGSWFVLKFFWQKYKGRIESCDCVRAEANEKVISTRETFFLAMALMVNNMGFGIGAKIAGLPILLTAVCTFLCSILLLKLGLLLGRIFGSTLFGRYAELSSGLIVIILGVYEFLF